MGNGIGKIGVCFTGGGPARNKEPDFYLSDHNHLYDESLGHSFCYIRPDHARPVSSKIHSEESAAGSIFRSISGASVSANTSTSPLSAGFIDPSSTGPTSGPLFESSTSFASAPLQPIPRSGPILPASGPIADRGFLSGPIERAGFLSGPLDRVGPTFSGPLDRSYSHNGGWLGLKPKRKINGRALIRGLRIAIGKTFGPNSVVAPVKGGNDSWIVGGGGVGVGVGVPNLKTSDSIGASGSLNLSSETSLDDMETWASSHNNLQWAQGRAGEDRVHVVVSEEHGWVFVGIYDGFNGPDATDFLLSNLYTFVQKELKGLLWDDCSKLDSFSSSSSSITSTITNRSSCSSSSSCSDVENLVARCCDFYEQERCMYGNGDVDGGRKKGRKWKTKHGLAGKKWGENQRRWKCEWDRERIELDRRLKEQWAKNDPKSKAINHGDVLKALAQALQKTEDSYLDISDKMLDENPELALMGSCVLAMLMKGEDVYVVNVGDSRAVLAQNKEPDLRLGKVDQDLERINEESMYDFHVSDGVKPTLRAVQLTMDHSTCVDEEVVRIRGEHPDDASAVVNDRVKGSLKVTRAFGAGFLKQPKWNDALLEMFRIDYVGTSPYINCLPSLCHHRLGPKDQFLLLSSDGLYQYFTNEEAVAEVELFISLSPDGDPAQHLVEEVLLRAAKKAGMDFYELLDIPQGDRRKYHDDVSIIIISFEGRIWRSCV